MERTIGKLIVSATDLVGHLACGHLTVLDGRVSTGGLAKPVRDDPELAVLTTRGLEHERRYLETLKAEGLHVVEIAEPVPRAFELRADVTPHDAAYIGLAEALGCPLLTGDAHLAAAPGPRREVRLLTP